MKNNNFSEIRNNFLRKAEELLRQNNLSEALNCAEEWLFNFPADADALAVCCDALIGMDRLEEMRKLLNEVAEIISGFNLINERAGDACREKGFHREAAACYEKFISLRPDAERSREIIGKMAFLEQEDSSSARIDFTDDKNASENNFFTVTMALLYIEQGHFNDAQIILEEIIKKEPDNRQALAALEDLKVKMISQSIVSKGFSKNDNLINVLSSWLKNIERLKVNAAAK
jgi:tetratricopeptide (TPR) repeat protein